MVCQSLSVATAGHTLNWLGLTQKTSTEFLDHTEFVRQYLLLILQSCKTLSRQRINSSSTRQGSVPGSGHLNISMYFRGSLVQQLLSLTCSVLPPSLLLCQVVAPDPCRLLKITSVTLSFTATSCLSRVTAFLCLFLAVLQWSRLCSSRLMWLMNVEITASVKSHFLFSRASGSLFISHQYRQPNNLQNRPPKRHLKCLPILYASL